MSDVNPPDRRRDIPTRERLEQIGDALAQRETELNDLIEAAGRDRKFLERQARRLTFGALVGGLLVALALGVGGVALHRAHNAADAAKKTANDQIGQRFDALVQSCIARNAQNVGIVGFLASVDDRHRTPQQVADDRRVAPFFPVRGFPLPNGRQSAETLAYCDRYARGLTSK